MLLAIIIIFCFILRVGIDALYSDEKPFIVVVGYTLLVVSVAFVMLMTGEKAKVLRKIIYLLLLFISLFISSLYSDVQLFDYVNYALQIYMPCLFLIAATSRPDVMLQAAIWFKRYFFVPLLGIVLAAIYAGYVSGNDNSATLVDYYRNSPNHVLAQALLKISLIMNGAGFIGLLVPYLTMLLINVRSVILAYTLAMLFFYKDIFLTKYFIRRFIVLGLPIFLLIFVTFDWADVLTRLIFKGGEFRSSTDFSTATSGRTEIYAFYISYMVDNFTLREILFGAGPIWLTDNVSLAAHNDVLNSMVSYGLVGLVFVVGAYWYFYLHLPAKGRVLFFVSFVVLFMTNGVLFHQSNILFGLLFLYMRDSFKARF